MAKQAPDDFSDDFQKWKVLNETCRESVFFVMVKPTADALKQIKQLVKDVKILPDNATAKEMYGNRTATGFVVEEDTEELKLLTCAHLLDHIYTAKKPIDVEEANLMFTVSIFCDHAEMDYLGAVRDRRNVPRNYGIAKFASISCSRDLLLIKIPKESISFLVDKVKGQKQPCCKQHPAIPPSISAPAQLDDSLMLSWHADMHGTVAKSRLCHGLRTIRAMPGDNPHGYDMNLLQVDVRSNVGCSGSPLLDDSGRFMGILHGGDTVWSYYISLKDIRFFLIQCISGGRVPRSVTAKTRIKDDVVT